MTSPVRRKNTHQLSGPGTGTSGGQFTTHTGDTADVDSELRIPANDPVDWAPDPSAARTILHDTLPGRDRDVLDMRADMFYAAHDPSRLQQARDTALMVQAETGADGLREALRAQAGEHDVDSDPDGALEQARLDAAWASGLGDTLPSEDRDVLCAAWRHATEPRDPTVR